MEEIGCKSVDNKNVSFSSFFFIFLLQDRISLSIMKKKILFLTS